MKRTTEQIDADNALIEAVKKTAEVYGILNGGMLIDFMVICEGVSVTEEEEEEHGILFMENRTRTTVALGMLVKADEMMSMKDVDLGEDEDGEG